MSELELEGVGLRWKSLYRIGAWAALLTVVLIPVQVVIYLVSPPPETVTGWFALLQSNWFLGLLNLDLLYLLTNVLLALIYLALYASLKKVSPSLMLLALALGLVGIAAYFPSNVGLEMLSLSKQYAAATTEAGRSVFLAAGEAMLAVYIGTTFAVYYVLNAAALLLIAAVMLRSGVYGKVTAWAGIVAGVFMIVPSTFGTLGLIFSMASLIPWAVFSVLVALRLLKIAASPVEQMP